jgi:filamentous hemagglutinin
MTRLGDASVIKQPSGPFCGPTTCAMVLESAGKKVDVNELISQLDKKVVGDGTNKTDGVFMKDLVPLLSDRGIPATRQRLPTPQLEKALESGNPAIVNVKRPIYDPKTGLQQIDNRGKPVWGGHAVVIDNIKLVHGKKSVAIRDPHGKQYYQLYENFQKDFLFEAITTKGVY